MRKTVSALAGIVLGLLFLASAVANAGENPAFDVKWYGFIKLDGSYDQNLTSHGNFAMWVKPQVNGRDDEQFNMTANQTRIGAVLNGTGYHQVRVAGKIELDLYGGVSGATVAQNKALVQLRHAYFTIQSGNTKLLAGQSFDLVSPLNPATLNYTELWGCGNIGHRRAQASLWHTAEAGQQTTVTAAGGAFRTIGDDLTPTFSLAAGEMADGLDDGTDAGIPSFQGQVDIKHDLRSAGYVRMGVSGLWGRLKAETNFGNYETYKSWATVGHFEVVLPSGWGFSGEAFTGANLGTYLGGILNSSTIEGVATGGGWASAWVKPAPKVKVVAGFGVDDPADDDLGAGARSHNSCVFGNVTYAFVPQTKIGLEVSNWQTKYKDGDTAKNMRVQTSFVLYF